MDLLAWGYPEKALQDIEKAIALNPGVGAAWYFHGLALLNLKRTGYCDDFARAMQRGFRWPLEKPRFIVNKFLKKCRSLKNNFVIGANVAKSP